jgi:hypothetical protein
MEQRIAQMIGLDQGRQAWELQRDEQNEAERRTYDTYLSDLYGDIMGVDFQRPQESPWIRNYLQTPIQGGNPPGSGIAPPGDQFYRGPTGPDGSGGQGPYSPQDNVPMNPDAGDQGGLVNMSMLSDNMGVPVNKAQQPMSSNGGYMGNGYMSTADSERLSLTGQNASASGAEPGCVPGTPGCMQESCVTGYTRGADGRCYNAQGQVQTGAVSGTPSIDRLMQDIARQMLQDMQRGNNQPGGNTLYPPGTRQGSYSLTNTSFNPADTRTYGLLAKPMAQVSRDADSQRNTLLNSMPAGGERDRALSQVTNNAYGRMSGLRGNLVQDAMKGIEGMAGRQFSQGSGTNALSAGTNLASGNQQMQSNLLGGFLNQQQQDKNNKSSLFGSLLSSLGSLGAAAIFKSDVRAKKDLVKTDETLLGLPIYEFTYNKRGEEAAGHRTKGLLAQDVEKRFPAAVLRDSKGTKYINYTKLLAAMEEE